MLRPHVARLQVIGNGIPHRRRVQIKIAQRGIDLPAIRTGLWKQTLQMINHYFDGLGFNHKNIVASGAARLKSVWERPWGGHPCCQSRASCLGDKILRLVCKLIKRLPKTERVPVNRDAPPSIIFGMAKSERIPYILGNRHGHSEQLLDVFFDCLFSTERPLLQEHIQAVLPRHLKVDDKRSRRNI